jgi:cell wall-associated NlpC family hydrolase
MSLRSRFQGVRLSLFFASLLFLLPLGGHAEESTPAPKKKGGYIGATPKLVRKPSSEDATPSPKKKFSSTGESGATEKKKVSSEDEEPSSTASKSKSKKTTSDEATPAPKKKSTTREGDEPAAKKSTSEDEEGTTTSTKSGRKKTAIDEAVTSARKKQLPAEDEVVSEKKATTSDGEPAVKVKTTEGETVAVPPVTKEHAPAATIAPEELAEFATLPPRVQTLITAALELTKLNLTYTYGSDEPSRGGMDCSGAMSYLLKSQGFKDVPRDSSSQYAWARKAEPFFAVVSKSADSFEFKNLQPGDLLFWTGTYETGREIPISHVMLYLGTEKKSKKRVMFGSSDGRSYNGVSRWGVSVFDFKMPRAETANGERSKVDFVGYGRIPGLHAAADTAPVIAAATEPKQETKLEEETKPAVSEDEPAPSAKKSTSGQKKSGTSGKTRSKSGSTKSKASRD